MVGSSMSHDKPDRSGEERLARRFKTTPRSRAVKPTARLRLFSGGAFLRLLTSASRRIFVASRFGSPRHSAGDFRRTFDVRVT